MKKFTPDLPLRTARETADAVRSASWQDAPDRVTFDRLLVLGELLKLVHEEERESMSYYIGQMRKRIRELEGS